MHVSKGKIIKSNRFCSKKSDFVFKKVRKGGKDVESNKKK